jgi:hypothetical protein
LLYFLTYSLNAPPPPHFILPDLITSIFGLEKKIVISSVYSIVSTNVKILTAMMDSVESKIFWNVILTVSQSPLYSQSELTSVIFPLMNAGLLHNATIYFYSNTHTHGRQC